MVPGERATGAIRAPHDPRDYQLRPLPTATVLPAEVDLRAHCPPIQDQGQIGACTAFAITAAARIKRLQRGWKDYPPSWTWTYWWERRREHTTGQDSGANVRDGMDSMRTDGLCAEAAWPNGAVTLFLDPEATWASLKFLAPPNRLIAGEYLMTRDPQASGHHHKCLVYEAVPMTPQGVKEALAQGHPVVMCADITETFFGTGAEGKIPTPDWGHERVVAGHAFLAVGYTTIDGDEKLIIRNSWGPTWGIGGYGYMSIAGWFSGQIPLFDFYAITAMAA